jgi:hypothetical protein
MACNPGEPAPGDYSAYYLPLESIPPGGITYRYKNQGDPGAPPEVWKHFRKGKDLIESINYAEADRIVQRQLDRVVDNGVMTDSLILYSYDSTGQQHSVNVKIITPHRFPFQPGDSSKVWLTHLDWHQPEDSLHVTLQRRRSFAGDTVWMKDNKSIPAVRFKVADTFETERDGWTSSTWGGEEIYAKGIGLVYYKRKISDQLILEFQLE